MIDSFIRNDSTVGAQANVNDNYGTISNTLLILM